MRTQHFVRHRKGVLQIQQPSYQARWQSRVVDGGNNTGAQRGVQSLPIDGLGEQYQLVAHVYHRRKL